MKTSPTMYTLVRFEKYALYDEYDNVLHIYVCILIDLYIYLYVYIHYIHIIHHLYIIHISISIDLCKVLFKSTNLAQ